MSRCLASCWACSLLVVYGLSTSASGAACKFYVMLVVTLVPKPFFPYIQPII